jgi:hypothetical protein
VLLRLNAAGFPWPGPLEQMADQAVARLIGLETPAKAPRLTAIPRRTAMHPTTASRHRPPATTVAWLAGAPLVSAVIPAAAGLAFLISLAARRPLVAVAARRWPWLTGRSAAQPSHRTLTGLTATWGIGLLAAAAVQGAGAITGGLTFTSPLASPPVP